MHCVLKNACILDLAGFNNFPCAKTTQIYERISGDALKCSRCSFSESWAALHSSRPDVREAILGWAERVTKDYLE